MFDGRINRVSEEDPTFLHMVPRPGSRAAEEQHQLSSFSAVVKREDVGIEAGPHEESGLPHSRVPACSRSADVPAFQSDVAELFLSRGAVDVAELSLFRTGNQSS